MRDGAGWTLNPERLGRSRDPRRNNHEHKHRERCAHVSVGHSFPPSSVAVLPKGKPRVTSALIGATIEYLGFNMFAPKQGMSPALHKSLQTDAILNACNLYGQKMTHCSKVFTARSLQFFSVPRMAPRSRRCPGLIPNRNKGFHAQTRPFGRSF